ncbi:hypothetical protein ACINWC348_1739 [Acinetobacter baumannii WC-348]|nr:hypothetical protein ACINWC348_1739 [Acinetobacter baumannii WC-348]
MNDRNETNVKGVFAAGDCTTVPYKQSLLLQVKALKHHSLRLITSFVLGSKI